MQILNEEEKNLILTNKELTERIKLERTMNTYFVLKTLAMVLSSTLALFLTIAILNGTVNILGK